MKLVLDMMGGDNGSKVTVATVKECLKQYDDIYFYCVGNVEELKELEGLKNVTIVPSKSVLKMDVDPMEAMHQKDSSLNVSMDTFVKEKADALLSAGSTGALVSEGVFKIKRLQGIKRPCLLSTFPTIEKGKNFVCADLGANIENTSENLHQFARMSSIYYKIVFGEKSPRVCLLNNGTEEEKGTELCKETYKILKEDSSINFCGNLEGRDALFSKCDVLISDGFSGNIFLKATEGGCKAMATLIKKAFKKNIFTKIGYLFARKGFKELSETMDYKNVGGAILLGVNGVIVKAHGNSDVQSLMSSIKIAKRAVDGNIIEKIKESI